MISLRMLSSLMDCFGHPQEDLMNQFLLTLLNRDDLALAWKIHEFLGLVLLQHPPSCTKSRMYYAKIFSLCFRREPLTAPNSDLCTKALDFTTSVLRRCTADPSDVRTLGTPLPPNSGPEGPKVLVDAQQQLERERRLGQLTLGPCHL